MRDTRACYMDAFNKLGPSERFHFLLGVEAAMELAEENGGELGYGELAGIVMHLDTIDRDLRKEESADV